MGAQEHAVQVMADI